MTAPLIRRDRAAREAEEERLSPAATRSTASLGRARPEPDDPDRTCFERDRDRVLHSKAFRRLKHKTQVVIDPREDHTVTRLTHTLQVSQIARALARGLGLNEPLAEAIALAHDVGHTPFGHTGEEALAAWFDGGWWHNEQSVRIYEVLEDRNLTAEVRDGVLRHPWRVTPPPTTPEAVCVRYADRIAYLAHDALDALRVGALVERDIPANVRRTLGEPGSPWIDVLVRGVLSHSAATGEVGLDPALLDVMHSLRDAMFERVYRSPENVRRAGAAAAVVHRLVEHLVRQPHLVPATYADPAADALRRAADYVAGMTDRFALALHDRVGACGARPGVLSP